MRSRWVLAGVLWVAATAAALEVPLSDGTVIVAVSHQITGSYVTLELADGSRVAYDIADVDLEALRAAEQAADATGGTESPPKSSRETISGGRSLSGADAAAGGGKDGLMISDRDVKHVRGSDVRGHEEQQEVDVNGDNGIPDGYREGGRVILNNVRVNPLGEGQWQVEGEVVNRDSETVIDVSVMLQTAAVDADDSSGVKVPVASYLGPDDKASFSHTFAVEVAEGDPEPSVRARVVWTYEGARRESERSKATGRPGG